MGYVGSSQHVYRRLHAHIAMLNGKRHCSPHLQAAWSKYGRAAFKLLLLEARAGTSEELLALENAYLSAIDRELLFNTTVPAVIGREHGFKHSDETKAKMSRSKAGKHTPHTARLTAEQVQEIRELYSALFAKRRRLRSTEHKAITLAWVAERYCVSLTTVWHILKGRTWK